MFHATVALAALVCYWFVCVWLENDNGVDWGNVWSRFAPFALLYLCIQAYMLVTAVLLLGSRCG